MDCEGLLWCDAPEPLLSHAETMSDGEREKQLRARGTSDSGMAVPGPRIPRPSPRNTAGKAAAAEDGRLHSMSWRPRRHARERSVMWNPRTDHLARAGSPLALPSREKAAHHGPCLASKPAIPSPVARARDSVRTTVVWRDPQATSPWPPRRMRSVPAMASGTDPHASIALSHRNAPPQNHQGPQSTGSIAKAVEKRERVMTVPVTGSVILENLYPPLSSPSSSLDLDPSLSERCLLNFFVEFDQATVSYY